MPRDIDLQAFAEPPRKWQIPRHSRTQVNAAGRALVATNTTVFERTKALDVINNWRAAHAFPLNSFQMTLRQRARSIYPSSTVVQRLKRLQSIEQRLLRGPTSRMQLARMQDIGGCRAVLRTVSEVRRLARLYHDRRSRHELASQADYIEEPRASGYRSIHLVYRFKGKQGHWAAACDGLRIEVQVRSMAQHAWATAVETAGTFLDQSLKSSEGSEEWLQFFALVSAAFAQEERTAKVPGTPDDPRRLKAAITDHERALDVLTKLGNFSAAAHFPESQMGFKGYYLMEYDPSERATTVFAFPPRALDAATDHYLEREEATRDIPGASVVMVKAESLDSLRRAYPNFFMDTQRFVALTRRVLAD